MTVLLVGASSAGTAVYLLRDEDEQGRTPPAARTPVQAVTAFYEAVGRGDCRTVDQVSTPELRAEVRGSGRGCAWLAEAIAADATAAPPDEVASVPPSPGDEAVTASTNPPPVDEASAASTDGPPPDEASADSASRGEGGGTEQTRARLPGLTGVRVRHLDERLSLVDVGFDLPDAAPNRVVRRALLRQADRTWAVATAGQAREVAPGPLEGFEPDVTVFLARDITEARRVGFEGGLLDQTEVMAFEYRDQQESEAEYRRLFAGNQAMLDRLEPGLLPTSYRLLLDAIDQPTLDRVVAAFTSNGDVMTVQAAPMLAL